MNKLLAVILPLAAGAACGTAPQAEQPAADQQPVAAPGDHDHDAEGHGEAAHANSEAGEQVMYTCPMHPEIMQSEPGSCPRCGMNLVQAEHHEGGEHEHHAGMSGAGMHGHMAHMNDVKKMLQDKLGAAYDQPVAGLDDADPGAGKEIYDTTCASCHGTSGKGDGPAAAALPVPPSDHTDPVHAAYYSDAGRIEVIKHGIPGTPMAGFGAALSDTDLLNLYAYVKSLRQEGGEAGGHHHDEDHDEDHHEDHDQEHH